MRRPPKYVQGFIDRHGKPRYYLRRSGHKSLPLPGLPWTPAFMAAYQAAMEDAPRVEIGASRTKHGTVAAAVVSYFNSWAFRNLADETRRTRKNILERFREQHGDKSAAALRRRSHGSPACSRRRSGGASTKDRTVPRNSRPSSAASDPRGNLFKSSDISDYPGGQAFLAGGLHELVSRHVQ
jgi:hypothetical protein